MKEQSAASHPGGTPQDHRLWVCQEGGGQDLDTLWDPGVPRSGNHPVQGKVSICGNFLVIYEQVAPNK
jgi:hypothetical protein